MWSIVAKTPPWSNGNIKSSEEVSWSTNVSALYHPNAFMVMGPKKPWLPGFFLLLCRHSNSSIITIRARQNPLQLVSCVHQNGLTAICSKEVSAMHLAHLGLSTGSPHEQKTNSFLMDSSSGFQCWIKECISLQCRHKGITFRLLSPSEVAEIAKPWPGLKLVKTLEQLFVVWPTFQGLKPLHRCYA